MTQKINTNELSLWMQLIFDLTGIALSAEKEYLIIERFQCLFKKYNCSSFSQLYFMAKDKQNVELREDIIDQITTKETSFFRDQMPFEALKSIVFPELLSRCNENGKKRPIKIWCAACSTGQEPYSVAMTLRDMGVQPHDFSIFATDISRQAVEAAKRGCYNRFEIERGMPNQYLSRFFTPCNGDKWCINDVIKQTVSFQRINLHQAFVLPETFDLIICRNVAIYFSQNSRRELFSRVSSYMQNHGYLMLGSTESVRDLSEMFQEIRPFKQSVFFRHKDCR